MTASQPETRGPEAGRPMTEAGGPPLKLGEWLAELRAQASLEELALDAPSERAILDLARVAAHRSERIAAPISAYLVGLACARLPEPDRAAWLERLVARLEAAE